MKNMLLEPVEYKIEEGAFGTWRSFLYPTGQLYNEYTTHMRILGLPFLHYTRGICPETGRRKAAKGFIAIGRCAVGILAIGQAALGLIAVGQAAFGLLLGLGQLSVGVASIGQMALGLYFGLGQFAFGHIAIGQLAVGSYVLAQLGGGAHVWSTKVASPEAQEFFRSLVPWLQSG